MELFIIPLIVYYKFHSILITERKWGNTDPCFVRRVNFSPLGSFQVCNDYFLTMKITKLLPKSSHFIPDKRKEEINNKACIIEGLQ